MTRPKIRLPAILYLRLWGCHDESGADKNAQKNIYHHIGIYIYNVLYLEKFVQLKQTQNEKSQKLEQLRLMDNNIEIDVGLAKTKPIGVDTDEDYLEIKKIMEYKN